MGKSFLSTPRGYIEAVLLTLLLLLLLYSLYEVTRVFFGVFTFSVIFAVSFAKLFKRFVIALGGRRKLAATLYCIVLIAIIASPLVYIISTLAHSIREAIHWINEARVNGIPPLPEWITNLPYAGESIRHFWEGVQTDPKEMYDLHEAQIKPILHRILTGGAGIFGVVFELILGIIISAMMLVNEKQILRPLQLLTNHLFGLHDGPAMIASAGTAVRSVSIGVIGTAFIAAIVSWLGLAIAGIQFALALAALVFFLVLIQIGPILVWIPLVIWLFSQGKTGWAVFELAWGALVIVLDAVLKPVLIARSGKLPFLVLFIGVIGGMVAWGFVGMFKGAIILAVIYTLVKSWLDRTRQPDTQSAQ